jgi:hypothetical protein
MWTVSRVPSPGSAVGWSPRLELSAQTGNITQTESLQQKHKQSGQILIVPLERNYFLIILTARESLSATDNNGIKLYKHRASSSSLTSLFANNATRLPRQNNSRKRHIAVFINPLKPKLVKIILKNSVRTSKKTQPVTITKINLLTLFKKIIAVYTKNRIEPINIKYRTNDYTTLHFEFFFR